MSLPSRTDTVVVGAGHAGLAASAALAGAGLDHVVLERDRIGESWRSQRWDAFLLNTIRRMSGLSGDGFAPASELVAELERRAERLPVTTGIAVEHVRRTPTGGFVVETSDGTIRADNVVAASGAQRVPRLPAVAATVSARGIEHLHTADYRNPAMLPDGGVLVVGSGQSGVQIAEDLLGAGRRVYLCTSKVARMPRRYRGRDTTEWWAEMGLYDQAPGEAAPERPPQVGAGRTTSLQQLARDGAILLGRLRDADGTFLRLGDELGEHVRYADAAAQRTRERIDAWIARHGIDAPAAEPDPREAPCGPLHWPRYLDLQAEGITSVIWATGFGGDYSWLSMPVLRPDGVPYHHAGATPARGLYVVGVPWQTRRSSGILMGMERDAATVVARIAGTRTATSAPALQQA